MGESVAVVKEEIIEEVEVSGRRNGQRTNVTQ